MTKHKELQQNLAKVSGYVSVRASETFCLWVQHSTMNLSASAHYSGQQQVGEYHRRLKIMLNDDH